MADAEALKGLIPQVLCYEPDSGQMHWRTRSPSSFSSTGKRSADWVAANWNSRHAGKPAFTAVGIHGYRCGRLQGSGLLLHRVAFVLMTGDWPTHELDHINGDRLDNRWCNLRKVTRGQNSRNKGPHGKTSDYIGVSWNSSLGGYMSAVYHNGKKHYCGFSVGDPERLARQRDRKAKELFGEYARLNFKENAT